tara:strand:+ start:129 stop:389 length:261 start_codon:yes stop_codon:yes gene_type:complete
MAGRGMGMATKGGGAVRSGPRNKVLKTKSKTTGIPMYNKGGSVGKSFPDLNKDGKVSRADVLMGRGVKKKMMGGSIKKYRKGGMCS